MRQATFVRSLWQSLLAPFLHAFTRPGHRRFVEWITALALDVEEHTVTQSAVAIERTADWKALESFAAYGARHPEWVTATLTARIEGAPGRSWHGYHVHAVDDTKVHRSGADVWGTCTFREYTARCPNRATTVRAHNWVVLGALLQNPGQPAWFLPVAGRLYFRKSQRPYRSGSSGPKEEFRTKCVLAVDLIREQVRLTGGKHLAVFDGGFALKSVVRPLVAPEAAGGAKAPPRVEFLTRRRHDARLYEPPPPERPQGKRGRWPQWGKKLPPPRQGGRGQRWWHHDRVSLYGRERKVQWKEVVCLWRAAGHDVLVKAVVAKVQGSKKRFTLVTSAVELTGLQMVELFGARFRQEDGFRDLKQRLGWEECRAWTRHPIERTTRAQWVTLSLLRLLQFRLDAAGVPDWWSPPPWDRKEERPSVLDVERLMRRYAPEIRRLLSQWLGAEEQVA